MSVHSVAGKKKRTKAILSKYKVNGRDRPIKEMTQLFLASQSGDCQQGQEQEEMDPIYSMLCLDFLFNLSINYFILYVPRI